MDAKLMLRLLAEIHKGSISESHIRALIEGHAPKMLQAAVENGYSPTENTTTGTRHDVVRAMLVRIDSPSRAHHEQLGWSVRAANCATSSAAGLVFLGELALAPKEELLKVRGVGKAVMKDFDRLLKRHKLCLEYVLDMEVGAELLQALPEVTPEHPEHLRHHIGLFKEQILTHMLNGTHSLRVDKP